MKINDYKQMKNWLVRPDNQTPAQRKALEEKKAAAEVNRKNKKRAQYGMAPIKNPLDKVPHNFVKAYNTYEDGENIVVGPNNQIMMESELKKLYEEEAKNKTPNNIGEYFRNEATPEQVGKLAENMERARQINGGDGRYIKTKPIKPKKKNSVINVPVSNMPVPYIHEPITRTPEDIKLEENFNKMVRESEEKKISNQNSGLANLLGGSKAYD